MTQMNFSDAKYAGKRKQTRRESFLAEMEQVVPWVGLLALIESLYSKAGNGRPPYPLKTQEPGKALAPGETSPEDWAEKGIRSAFGSRRRTCSEFP